MTDDIKGTWEEIFRRNEQETKQFAYQVGQHLRIKDGIYAGDTFVIENEDDRQMSNAVQEQYARPQYYYKRHGRWYFEDEVEPAS